MILGLLNNLSNFALLSLVKFDQFYTLLGWVAGGGPKLRLKTNSAQLKLKLGLSLAIKYKKGYQLSLWISNKKPAINVALRMSETGIKLSCNAEKKPPETLMKPHLSLNKANLQRN